MVRSAELYLHLSRVKTRRSQLIIYCRYIDRRTNIMLYTLHRNTAETLVLPVLDLSIDHSSSFEQEHVALKWTE